MFSDGGLHCLMMGGQHHRCYPNGTGGFYRLSIMRRKNSVNGSKLTRAARVILRGSRPCQGREGQPGGPQAEVRCARTDCLWFNSRAAVIDSRCADTTSAAQLPGRSAGNDGDIARRCAGILNWGGGISWRFRQTMHCVRTRPIPTAHDAFRRAKMPPQFRRMRRPRGQCQHYCRGDNHREVPGSTIIERLLGTTRNIKLEGWSSKTFFHSASSTPNSQLDGRAIRHLPGKRNARC